MKQIIYYIKSLLLLLIFAGGVAACADDLGNYDYNDIPEITISGIDSTITTMAFTDLSITVTLGGLQSEAERYEYEWLVVRQFTADGSGTPASDILATTKDFNERITLTPGPYRLIYTVTDKHLNVFYQQQSNLTVITSTSEGWVLLCSDNGRVRLDMVSEVLGETMHAKDMLSESEMPFKNGPRRLIALSSKDSGTSVTLVDPISPFYLLTDEGATRLHREAFEWQEEYLIKYEMGDMEDVIPTHITAASYFRMMISEVGITYSDYMMGPTGLWGSPLNYIRQNDNSKKTINVAPYVGCNFTNVMQYSPSFMFYDLDNKCFVYHPGGVWGELTGDYTVGCIPMNDYDAWGSGFSFPTGYNYVYMENTGRQYAPSLMMPGLYDNITFTILDNNGTYHLYGISLGDNYIAMMGMGGPYTKTHYANLSDCESITSASHFAFSPLNNQMFYAVGGKVYRVDLNSTTPTADYQFTVPGNITCMKFYQYLNSGNISRSYDLIVASDKGGTEGGELRTYDAVNNLTQITEHKEMHSGFARIVDVIYKESL